MSYLDDFRATYPQYKDWNDERLASALYEKYGEGKDKFDFWLDVSGKGKRATPFEVGMAGLKSAGQTGIAALESKLGFEEAAQENLKAAQERQKEVAGRYKREVPTAEDINWSPSRAARYLYETGAESLPYMIPPLAGGIVGGIVGGPIGAGIGATAANIPVFTSTNIQRQIEEGKSLKDVDVGKAALTAIPQSAADALIGRYIPFLGKAGTGGLIRRTVMKGLEGGVVGSLTESAQQALEILQANPEKFTEFGPEVRRELVENAIAGGLLEGGLGAATGVVGRSEPKIAPTTPPTTTSPTTTAPTEPTAPAPGSEPTVTPPAPGEPVTVPPQGNEWMQQNAKNLEAFNEAPMEHQVVEPSAKVEPPKAGETRVYFDPSITDKDTGATALYVNPKDLTAVKPNAAIKYVDIPQSFVLSPSSSDPKASYVTDPAVDKDLVSRGQDFALDEGKKLPVKFTSVVDKALYAVAKKTNPEQFNLAKDYLSKGLGMSEDEIDLKSREVSAQIDKHLEDRKQAYGKGHAPEASITVPRFSEEASVATFPVEPRETIGGIDVNTTDPAEQQKIKDIEANSPLRITDQSKAAFEKYAPGVVDLVRDLHLKLFPGLKINLRTSTDPGSFGWMDPSKAVSGEFTIAVNLRDALTPHGMLRTLFHEFSHVFEYTWFTGIPKDQLRAIIDQYVRETVPTAARRMAAYEVFEAIQKAKASEDINGEQLSAILKGKVEKNAKGQIVLKGTPKVIVSQKEGYYHGFGEWIAEKGANWYMNSDRVPRTALQKVFKKFYDGLRKIYYEISKHLGMTPDQGAFEQLLSDIYGRQTSTPLDIAGKFFQTKMEAEAAAKKAGVPMGGVISERQRVRGGRIEDVMREAAVQEEARPGYTSMGDRIISEQHPLTEADIKETNNNPALLDPNIPPEVQSMAYFVGAKKPVGFWAGLFDKLTGREGNESYASAIVRNNIAAHLPFLQRADLREVGKTLERMQNAQGRMAGIIDSGHIVYDPKTGELEFRSKIGEREVGGLKKIFAPAGLKGEAALQYYMIAKRELDLRARGRTGIGYVDPATGKPFTTEQLKKIVEATPEHIKKVGQDLYEFNKEMVQFSIDTGVIPRELGDNLMSMFYTPFYRIQDAEIENNGNLTVAGTVGAALKNPSAVTLFNQKVTAGGKIDANFYENTFRNYSSIVTAGLKNIAYGKAAEALIKLRDPTIAQVVGKPIKNSITYRVEGGDRHLQINDPAMFQSLAAFSPKQLAGFVSAASKFANVLRTGVTTAPPFQIANFIRGLVDVYVKTGMPITDLAVGSIRGIKDALMHGTAARAIQAESGFGGFRYGATAESQAEGLRAYYAIKEGTATAGQRAMSLLGKLETIGDASEMGPRIAYYNWLINKKGMAPKEAAWEAVNLTNFSRSGAGSGISGSLIANLIPMVPFLNARLQGLYRLVEHGTAGAPTSIVRSGAIGLPTAIVMRGLMLTGIELGLNAIYGDDDWYKKLSVADKINNNYVRVGDTVVAIPRAFEIGSTFGAIPALVMDAIRKQDGKDLADGVGQIAMGTFLFNPIPQFVKPIAEIYFNKDMFTGRDIETIADKRRPSGERADEATSEIAKMIGEYTGMSPKKTDVLLRGYLGTLATTFTAVADGVLASAGNRPQGYFGDPTSATSIAANAIGLSRFVKAPEQLSNKYVKDFYTMVQDVTETVTSIKDSQDARDIEAVKAKLEKNPKAMAAYAALNRVESQITRINATMKSLRNNPDLPTEEKVKRLQSLRDQKNKLAEQAVTMAQEFGI